MAFQSSSGHSEAKKIPQKSRCPHHFACLFARLFVFVFQKKFFQPNPIGIAPKSFLDMKCFFLKMTKKLRKIFFCNGQKKMCEIFLSVFQKKIFFSKKFFLVLESLDQLQTITIFCRFFDVRTNFLGQVVQKLAITQNRDFKGVRVP